MAFTEEEYKTFAEKTLLFLIVMDKKGIILKVNEYFQKLFSFPNSNLIGQSLTNFILDEEKVPFQNLITKLIDNDSISSKIFQLVTNQSEEILSIKFNLIYKNDKIFVSGMDMTKENEAHNSLTTLSSITKTGTWSYTPSSKKLHFSKECYLLHDLKPGIHITIDMVLNYYHPESRKKIKKYLYSLINKKESFKYTEQLITDKGIKKWVRVFGKPIVHNGAIIQIKGSFADITKRHNYIETLKYNEETKHLALKGIRSGLFDHIIETNLVFYSLEFKKMLGLPLDQDFVQEKTFNKMIHPEDITETKKRHQENLSKEGNHYFNFYRLRHPDGNYRHYEIYGYRKKNATGETTRMIGNLIDVHQKKLNEQTIIQNQSRLLAMVNNGFAYTVLLNTEGKIIMADKNSIHIIKRDFNIDPTINSCFFIDVMPLNFKNTFAHQFNEALKGKIVKKEIQRIKYKGALQWLESKYVPIFNKDKVINSVLVSFHDITEQKAAELAIKEAHIKEQELSSLKSNILSNFSHEIRTPLNGIMTISNLLLTGEENPNDKKKLLEYLETSKDRFLKTMNNLSRYSDIKTIQNNLDYSEIDLNYTVETSYREYRHIANAKNIKYTLELDESCPIIYIDENIFQTALNNIIHNAIKYTNKGNIEIKINAKQTNQKAYIHIKDSGIGITDKNIQKIFDPFIQESVGLSRKYEGTGIGLSLSKKYIEILGGKIEVKSTVNKGTEFIIIIPLIQ